MVALKADARCKGKLTCVFTKFLFTGDFISESKIEELNQNKNSKQPHRPGTA